MTDAFLGNLDDQFLLGQWIIGSMVAARLSGVLIAMPSLSNGLPIRLRVLFVLVMTVAILPAVGGNVDVGSVTSPAELLLLGAREIILGMVIGGVVQLLVTGIQVAGELISSASGFQILSSADPTTGEVTPQLSRFLGVLVTAVLFAGGGHRLLIDALLRSFRNAAPLSASVDAQLMSLVIDQLSVGIECGLRVAAPILTCLLVTNLVVAIVSRTMPQLNVLVIGLNANMFVVLVVTALTLGSAGLIFEAELATAARRLGF